VSATVAALPCGLADEVGLNEIGLDEQLLSSGASDADSDAFEGQAAGCCDDLDADCPSRRFYITGIIGASFGTLQSGGVNNEGNFPNTGRATDSLLTAGGAIGTAFDRDNGMLRLEVEGMGRSTYDAPFTSPLRPDAATVLTDNWSVMQNFWRDLMITDRFGIYGGGGIGAGGYVFGQTVAGSTEYTTPAANFAWQAGGGLLWQLSDRLTFDVGYRYFHINTIQQADDVVPNQFAASELMFSLRLYEPFRNWRR
jgi:opacity protein-like surface antigen